MQVIEKWAPFRDLDLIDQRIRRLWSGFGLAPTAMPAADIYESGGEYIVELEVPGYDEKELQVQVSDHVLTVKGERKEEKETTEKSMHLSERLESSFERSFELPAEVDSAELKAEYAKGVLSLHLPKTAEVKPRTVEITKV